MPEEVVGFRTLEAACLFSVGNLVLSWNSNLPSRIFRIFPTWSCFPIYLARSSNKLLLALFSG